MKKNVTSGIACSVLCLIFSFNETNAQTAAAPTLGINTYFTVFAGGTLTDNNMYPVQGLMGTNSLNGTSYNEDSTFVGTEEIIEATTFLSEAIDFLNEQSGEESEELSPEAILTQGAYYFSNSLTLYENHTVTLSGSAEDVIIFNIDGDLTIEAGE